MREAPISQVFVKNLQRLIEQKDCTRQELAEAIGVTANNVTQWLIGNSLPRLGTLDKICSYFGVTRATIVTETTYDIVLMRDEEKHMFEQYDSMNVEGKQRINEYVGLLYLSGKHTKNTPLKS